MKTNKEFYKDIRSSASRYFLSDLHVHTPASIDVATGDRLDSLSSECKTVIKEIASMGLPPIEYEREVKAKYPPDRFIESLVAQRDQIAACNGIEEGMDWAFVGLTDHNVCAYSCEVARLAWSGRSENRIIVLPGLELDIDYPVDDDRARAHILCLFAPCVTESDIRTAIMSSKGNGNWELGTELIVDDLPCFVHALRNHDNYPSICIAAHIGSQKGVREETKKVIMSRMEVEIARIQQELSHGEDPDEDVLRNRLGDLQGQMDSSDMISMECLSVVGNCGFDALQVASEEDEVHYRYLHRYKPDYGRSIPIIASDAHRAEDVFNCNNGIPFLKLGSISSHQNETILFERVRHALRLGETRFCYTVPHTVQYWIAGLEVTPDSPEAEQFWPYDSDANNERSFFLPLSRNLNTFVGGRGSGKSAAIEALSFICRPEDHDKVERGDLPDWYTRAKATLMGCNIRLCFQFVGDGLAIDLPKRTMFVRRHFSSTEDFESNHFSDLSDHELVESQIPHYKVQIFRLGEIETHAGVKRLRNLFDTICGSDIYRLQEDINNKKEMLEDQRREIIDLAVAINDLSEADQPLTQYLQRYELLIEADRPEVKAAYERIDQLEFAGKTAKSACEDWKEIIDNLDIEGNAAVIVDFFNQYQEKSLTEKNEILPHHERLVEIIGTRTDDPEAKEQRVNRITQSANTFHSELKSLNDELIKFRTDIKNDIKDSRNEMQTKGLPTGSKDREAKKTAFDESKEALTLYCDLIRQLNEQFAAREALLQEYSELAEQRSKLRIETAQKITDRLGRDLDKNILVIEASAQARSDSKEFYSWLESYFASQSFRYRDQRLHALIDKNLTPSKIKEVLTSADKTLVSVLQTEGTASTGGIDATAALSLYEYGVAISFCSSEKQKDDVSDDVWANIPQEIKEGLRTFPTDTNGDLRLNSVLQLDEILFDDEPVILLNDRPQDEGSTVRPLKELSPGQRCSAILPILLLTGTGPVVIDQPEDNLDNRLIRQVIVNILASMKLQRQIIVATHNPNVPVLGDVENAVVLCGIKDKQCKVEATGDLETKEVVQQLTQVMEGGREAFQYRQTIYQSHWMGSVEQDED